MVFDLFVPILGNPVVQWRNRHEALRESCEVTHQLHDTCCHLDESTRLQLFGQFCLFARMLAKLYVEFHQMLDAQLVIGYQLLDDFECRHQALVLRTKLVSYDLLDA